MEKVHVLHEVEDEHWAVLADETHNREWRFQVVADVLLLMVKHSQSVYKH